MCGKAGGVKSWSLPVESSFATSPVGFTCLPAVGGWFGLVRFGLGWVGLVWVGLVAKCEPP